MLKIKYIPYILLLMLPQYSSAFDWHSLDTPENRQYALLATAGIGLTGFLYNWAGKLSANRKLLKSEYLLEKTGEEYAKTVEKYADHALLQDIYDKVSTRSSDYLDYTAVLDKNLSQEEQAKLLYEQLAQELLTRANGRYNWKIIATFESTLRSDRLALEKMRKELKKLKEKEHPY